MTALTGMLQSQCRMELWEYLSSLPCPNSRLLEVPVSTDARKAQVDGRLFGSVQAASRREVTLALIRIVLFNY